MRNVSAGFRTTYDGSHSARCTPHLIFCLNFVWPLNGSGGDARRRTWSPLGRVTPLNTLHYSIRVYTCGCISGKHHREARSDGRHTRTHTFPPKHPRKYKSPKRFRECRKSAQTQTRAHTRTRTVPPPSVRDNRINISQVFFCLCLLHPVFFGHTHAHTLGPCLTRL